MAAKENVAQKMQRIALDTAWQKYGNDYEARDQLATWLREHGEAVWELITAEITAERATADDERLAALVMGYEAALTRAARAEQERDTLRAALKAVETRLRETTAARKMGNHS
jgi:hypothetical protein